MYITTTTTVTVAATANQHLQVIAQVNAKLTMNSRAPAGVLNLLRMSVGINAGATAQIPTIRTGTARVTARRYAALLDIHTTAARPEAAGASHGNVMSPYTAEAAGGYAEARVPWRTATTGTCIAARLQVRITVRSLEVV